MRNESMVRKLCLSFNIIIKRQHNSLII